MLAAPRTSTLDDWQLAAGTEATAGISTPNSGRVGPAHRGWRKGSNRLGEFVRLRTAD
jgi:hypothetical protein